MTHRHSYDPTPEAATCAKCGNGLAHTIHIRDVRHSRVVIGIDHDSHMMPEQVEAALISALESVPHLQISTVTTLC